jgi:hypothetical protein
MEFQHVIHVAIDNTVGYYSANYLTSFKSTWISGMIILGINKGLWV